MKLFGALMVMLVLFMAMMATASAAAPIELSGIDPYADKYTGRLGIETIGVGDTPTIMAFEAHQWWTRNVEVLGGQKYIPPKVDKLGLMWYDHTRPLKAAVVPSPQTQFLNYQLNRLVA